MDRTAFENYLVHEYPAGRDYKSVGSGRRGFNMHSNQRDRKGNFEHLAGGRPDLRAAFVESLEGVPHKLFTEAIAQLETLQAGNTPGPYLTAALRFYQDRAKWEAEGWTPAKYAKALQTNERGLERLMSQAVEVVHYLVFNRNKTA